MTLLSRNERTDHLNLSREDREQAPNKFKKTIPPEKARHFIDQVSRKESGMLEKSNILPIIRYAMTSALAKHLGGNPKITIPETKNELSMFFMHYFCWIHDRATESVRKQLIDRLCSEARGESGAMPLFIEMYAAFTYLFTKNLDVEFRFGLSNEKDWDLQIISDECTLSVEVKTVIYEAGIAIRGEDLGIATEIIKDAILETYNPEAVSLHIFAMAENQLSSEEANLAAEDIARQIRSGEKIPANKNIILYFKFRKNEDIKIANEYFSRELTPPDGGHTFISCPPKSNLKYYATVNYKNLHFNHGAIERQIRDAFEQLKGQPMQAAFIAVLGAHPKDYSTIEGGAAFQIDSGRLGNRLKQKSRSETENIAAISLSLDPFTLMRSDRSDTLAIQSFLRLVLTRARTETPKVYMRNFIAEHGRSCKVTPIFPEKNQKT